MPQTHGTGEMSRYFIEDNALDQRMARDFRLILSTKQVFLGRRFLPQGSQQLRGFSECSVKGILGQARKSENRLEKTVRGVMIG